MVAERDKLGRRNRREAVSTGKHIRLTDRDLHWLNCLARHGPLSSSFLLAYAQGMGQSEKRARERLTDLFNEENTPNKGAYLVRPPQQFRTLDSRYNQLVYDLSDAGRRALKARGITAIKHGGPWLHKYMVSSITASIELAIMKRSDLYFISQSQILDRASTELETEVKIANGKMIKLIPDALFGIEYLAKQGSRYRFFVVEADRATEPLTSNNLNRKSALRSLEGYQDYIGNAKYKSHLGLTAPLLVLNVFNEEARAKKVQELYGRKVPDGISYQLFQYWADFGASFRPPNPNDNLLQSSWSRAGKRQISIDSA